MCASSIPAICASRRKRAAAPVAIASEVRNVSTSMMTTGGMLWGAALYNNGAYPHKDTRFGESYARDGAPQTVRTIPPPTPEETRAKGILPEITPLERWEISQPGNVLRVFERGGGPKGEVGEPSRDRTTRGKARRQTQHARIWHAAAHRSGFSGPAENAAARSAALSAGHERSAGRLSRQRMHGVPRRLCERPFWRAFRAVRSFGNRGYSATNDPTIPHEESGHPIRHEFTRSIPSSQCMVCHIHPGTNMVDHVFRLHVVGQRIRRRRDVSEGAAQSHRGRKIRKFRSAIPKARRRAGCGRT